MKTIIAVLFLLVGISASAETGVKLEHREMYAENGEGGVLTITNDPCNLPGNPLVGHGWTATTELSDRIVDGCWIFADDAPALYVFWQNGFKNIITNPDAVFKLEKPQVKERKSHLDKTI